MKMQSSRLKPQFCQGKLVDPLLVVIFDESVWRLDMQRRPNRSGDGDNIIFENWRVGKSIVRALGSDVLVFVIQHRVVVMAQRSVVAL